MYPVNPGNIYLFYSDPCDSHSPGCSCLHSPHRPGILLPEE